MENHTVARKSTQPVRSPLGAWVEQGHPRFPVISTRASDPVVPTLKGHGTRTKPFDPALLESKDRKALGNGEQLNVATHLKAANVTVVDIDRMDPGLVEQIFAVLGETKAIVITASGGRHLYYRGRTTSGIGLLKRNGKLLVDILSGGRVAVLPPSKRVGVSEKPDGEYRFERGGIPDFLNALDRSPIVSNELLRELARALGVPDAQPLEPTERRSGTSGGTCQR